VTILQGGGRGQKGGRSVTRTLGRRQDLHTGGKLPTPKERGRRTFQGAGEADGEKVASNLAKGNGVEKHSRSQDSNKKRGIERKILHQL